MIIGAIIIGFGTSAPELLVTPPATLQGSQDLAFGNIVGSNTANVLLVIGAAAVVRSVVVTVPTLRRELPLMLAAVGLLALLTRTGRVTTVDAIILLVAAVASVGFIVWSALRDREAGAAMEAEVAEGTASVRASTSLAVGGPDRDAGRAQLLVTGATGIARGLGSAKPSSVDHRRGRYQPS